MIVSETTEIYLVLFMFILFFFLKDERRNALQIPK